MHAAGRGRLATGFLPGGFVAGGVVGENQDLVAGKGRVLGGGGVAEGVAVGGRARATPVGLWGGPTGFENYFCTIRRKY